MTWLGLHQGRPQTLVIAWSIAALAIAWKYGMEAGWGATLTIGSLVLILASSNHARDVEGELAEPSRRDLPGRLLTVHLGMMTALFIIVALSPQRSTTLTGQTAIVDVLTHQWLTIIGAVSLVLYMQRLTSVDALLPPTVAALGLLISMALAGQSMDDSFMQLSALGVPGRCSIWIAGPCGQGRTASDLCCET
jgi:hypothetical protein